MEPVIFLHPTRFLIFWEKISKTVDFLDFDYYFWENLFLNLLPKSFFIPILAKDFLKAILVTQHSWKSRYDENKMLLCLALSFMCDHSKMEKTKNMFSDFFSKWHRKRIKNRVWHIKTFSSTSWLRLWTLFSFWMFWGTLVDSLVGDWGRAY